MFTKCSYHQNFTGVSNQKSSLTKVVKEYVLTQEKSWRPVNMESFGHKIIILQPYCCFKTKTSLTKVVKEYVYIKEMQCIQQNIDSNCKKC